jgi:SteA-like C-terminal domain
VSRLYEGRVRRIDIILLVTAAVIAMIVVGIVAEPIHVFARGLWVTLKDLFSG